MKNIEKQILISTLLRLTCPCGNATVEIGTLEPPKENAELTFDPDLVCISDEDGNSVYLKRGTAKLLSEALNKNL